MAHTLPELVTPVCKAHSPFSKSLLAHQSTPVPRFLGFLGPTWEWLAIHPLPAESALWRLPVIGPPHAPSLSIAMRLRILLVVTCLFLGSAPATPSNTVAVVQPGGSGRRDPQVKHSLKALMESVHQRGKQDDEAVQRMSELVRTFKECGAADQASIVKAFGRCLAERRKELSKDQPDNKLYLAAAKGLGSMGEKATKTLVHWIDHKTHRANLDLQKELILSLGKTKDPKAVEHLVDLLDHNENRVGAWSAIALRNYKDAPSEVRKEAFNRVLIIVVTAGKRRNRRLLGRPRWKIVARPMKKTLVVLSGAKGRNLELWQRWWNKNKKRDWDK